MNIFLQLLAAGSAKHFDVNSGCVLEFLRSEECVSQIVSGYQGSVLGPARQGLFVTTLCQSGQRKGGKPNAFAWNAATGAEETGNKYCLQLLD